jgi:hypothetical protein
MLSHLNLDAHVPGFGVPTIVVAGTHDRLTPIWHARLLADTLPELLDFIAIDRSGHMTPVQSPDVVNQALRRLIRDHAEPAAEPAAGPAAESASRMQSATDNGSIKVSENPDSTQETS